MTEQAWGPAGDRRRLQRHGLACSNLAALARPAPAWRVTFNQGAHLDCSSVPQDWGLLQGMFGRVERTITILTARHHPEPVPSSKGWKQIEKQSGVPVG